MMRAMVLGAVMACALGTGASAATLTFDIEEGTEYRTQSYTEAGLTISALPGSAPVSLTNLQQYGEGSSLGYFDGGPAFEWQISADKPFNLTSVGVIHVDAYIDSVSGEPVGDFVTFRGFRDGEQVSDYVVARRGLHTFVGFDNLDYVTMSLVLQVVGDPRFSFMTWESAVPAPIPLPASVWLLGAALTGLGLARRRAS